MNFVLIWDKVLSNLELTLPKHALSAWFEPMNPVEIKTDTLIVEVPNNFFREWVESHYKSELVNALNGASGSSLNYRLKVSSTPMRLVESERDRGKKPQGSSFLPNNNLNHQYRFSNFIEGSNNEFAKNASRSVATSLGQSSFNPLIIYGGVGLGKTHLIHAIGNRVIKTDPSKKVIVVTSEKFTLDFVNSLRRNKTIEFAQKYRTADVLLIDDVQFFRGKEQTQEQFFHTFNVLYQAGKQIVLTTDKNPSEMKGLQSRLLSRFQSGLSVDIQPPNFELRVAILMEKAEQNGLELDYELIEFIARHIKDNIRDIEGAIIRILAKSSLMKREIDQGLVQEVIKERIGGKLFSNLTIEDIVKRVSTEMRVDEIDIVGKGRRMEVAHARQVAMYLCRDIINTSLNNIGLFFGGRDHTTVLHAVKTISRKVETSKSLKTMLKEIRQDLTTFS